MSGVSPPAGVLAGYDQTVARLRDLAATADRHASKCAFPDPPGLCIGRDAIEAVGKLKCAKRDDVLVVAIGELAAYGYHTDRNLGGVRLAQDVTADAIADALETRRDDPLAAALIAVVCIHVAQPATGPDSDCPTCEGSGSYFDAETRCTTHCHCGCPWCEACGEPVCEGACDTLHAIADRLNIQPTIHKGETT